MQDGEARWLRACIVRQRRCENEETEQGTHMRPSFLCCSRVRTGVRRVKGGSNVVRVTDICVFEIAGCGEGQEEQHAQ